MGFRDARMRAGKRVSDVTDALGVTRAAVSQWENGIYFPRHDKLLKLSRLYGCTVDDLLSSVSGGESQKTDS